ncbi:MAG: glycosyltransferase family 39 protein [Flavobacteriales bacterium]|nr:glycosyltransferase family 39 protein [Flavobacteriales bacterium]MCB9168088.1 glycosyltransferase family 39 protein [Flavobacteriales bacterium]
MRPTRILRDPLLAITLIALVPRLLAALFSGGYFAQDDHFLVIESAASWADGSDYNNWLPWHQTGTPTPSGHSMVYPGLHFLLFKLFHLLGLHDPEGAMIVIRLLHALWSLVVVRTGYRIAAELGGAEIAWRIGLLLALFYFMPFLAVRNLVEVACIPFLMLGVRSLMRQDGTPWRSALVAGIWLGLAMNVRFQTMLFAAGAGSGLLLERRWREVVPFALGVALPIVLLQGGIDLFIWGRPFAEIGEYVRYNAANATTYFDQPWYNYLLVLAGIFLFIGPFVLFGYFRRWRPLVPWLAVFAFLAFHSWHPNKQERFILPIVPLVLVLGSTAWERWRTASEWWSRRAVLWRWIMGATWALNVLLLVVLTFTYSKRGRVEAMKMLGGLPEVHGYIEEDSAEGEAPLLPLYYMGRWDIGQAWVTDTTTDLCALRAGFIPAVRPNYVLFIGEEDLNGRMARVQRQLGPLRVEGEARPSLVDRVVHWLNPVNRNETIVVTRLERP